MEMILLFILSSEKLINLSMYAENLDYLSRPSPSSPLLYKKSPQKYSITEPKFIEPYTLNKSLSHLSTEDWSVNDFQNLKKVADDVGNLRQTFDGRTQSKVQQILSKYDYDNEESAKPQKQDLNLRQTFNARPRYMENYRLSAPNATDNLAQFSIGAERQNKNMRSPMRSQKLQLEYNKYKEQLEELETTKKMAEQLRKLKEDRRKRLEANIKETKQTEYKKQESGDFKRKKYQDFYSPKYQKIDVNQNLELSKTMPIKKLNLQKYKIGAEYDNNNHLPNNVEQQSVYKSKSILQIPDTYGSRPIREVTSALLPSKASRKSSFLASTSLIDDFVVGKFLGEGRFGSCYQVFHKATGAIFAMKKISKENVKKLNMVNQLILELKIQTYLHHKNIVTLYHSFDDADYVYLLMEYMEQGTLFSQLKKKKTMPEFEVAQKIKEVSSAVKYLHQNEIAHRDIKPQNIVVTHGVCKLCDFGWATRCDSRRKTAIGTLDYTAPEIVGGEEYDESVDIWCLGVLTYELLIGKAPFYHIRRQETKKRILSVEKTAINYPENISKKAISFIDSLLKKDPNERLSAEDLLSQPFLQIKEEDL